METLYAIGSFREGFKLPANLPSPLSCPRFHSSISSHSAAAPRGATSAMTAATVHKTGTARQINTQAGARPTWEVGGYWNSLC